MKFLVLACIVLALGAVDSKKDGCSGAKKCKKARLCDQLGCDSDLENCEMFTVGAKTFAKCVPKNYSATCEELQCEASNSTCKVYSNEDIEFTFCQPQKITMKDTKEKPSKLRPDSNQNVTKDKNDDELEESSHRNRTKAEKPEEKSKLGQSGSRNSIRPVSPKPTELTPQRPSRPTAARPQRPAKPTGTTPQQPKKPAESTPQQPETSESPNPESDDGKKDSDRSGRPNRPNRPNRPKRAFPGRNKLGNMRHEQPDKSKQINRQHNNTSNCSRTKGEGLRPCSNYIKNGTKPDKLEKDNSRNGTHNSTESHKTKRPGKHDKPEQHNKPMKNAQTNTAKPTGAPLQRPTKPNSARPQRPRPTKPLSVTERPMQQKVPGRGGKPKP